MRLRELLNFLKLSSKNLKLIKLQLANGVPIYNIVYLDVSFAHSLDLLLHHAIFYIENILEVLN